VIGLDLSRVEYDDRVKELSYGRWEGRKVVDVRVNDALGFQSRLANRWDVPAPGGESYSMVAERLNHWLQEVEGQTIVLVSHGCAGRILRGIYSGLSKAEIYALEEPHDAIFLLENGGVVRAA
jgi:probable phosphoglycerate mutase